MQDEIQKAMNKFLDDLSGELEELMKGNSDYNKGVQDSINYLKSLKK